MKYIPGTHIVATLETNKIALLNTWDTFRAEADRLIAVYGLHNLGEVYHNFLPAGFTAVICLSESHISIHTWPEFGKVNVDIYLSNHQRSNDGTVQAIFKAVVSFFGAQILHQQNIIR